MRFSLSSLLILTTICALVFGIVPWFYELSSNAQWWLAAGLYAPFELGLHLLAYFARRKHRAGTESDQASGSKPMTR